MKTSRVDDILGEGSDDSNSKKQPGEQDGEQERTSWPRKPRAPAAHREQPLGLSSSRERSAAGFCSTRDHKRKLNDEDAPSESSKETSNEDRKAAALKAALDDLM
ncbi:RNA polymerase II subunit A C-terminal domain phosphatase [Fukomys damarensis]|uniref:RNA polymerase II subunit A C-terminal domain phosphatase n=1 Tax=Fukomys damarensis TaxID=885580 RepID=A0A091DD99_FUKDA|nr:RNA polymerase II subunit A C-terminal domain phosphatase [Fukomys damarensis]